MKDGKRYEHGTYPVPWVQMVVVVVMEELEVGVEWVASLSFPLVAVMEVEEAVEELQ